MDLTRNPVVPPSSTQYGYVVLPLEEYHRLQAFADSDATLTPIAQTAQRLTALISDRFMVLADDSWLGGTLQELRHALIDGGYHPDRV